MTPRGLAVLAVAALLAAPAAARKGPKELAAEELPSWVREAAAREVSPAGRTDFVWLHDETDVTVLAEGGVRIVRRRAPRVMDPSAMSRLGTWSVSYQRGDEVESLSAWALLADGTARVSGRKDDDVDLPAIEGYSIYEDSRVRLVTTPPSPVRSVVAFESSAVHRVDLGAEGVYLGDPDGATATARGLAPLPREPARPPSESLSPAIWAHWASPDGSRGFGSWASVGSWLRALGEPVLDEAGEVPQIATAMAPSGPSDLLPAVARGFGRAAREVRYVSIQVGIGGFKPQSPSDTWRLKYGDCKAKSFLLRSFLQRWGVRSFPVLVRTRDLGAVVPEVPTPGQFNHMIVAFVPPEDAGERPWATASVEGIGRLAFLDPTASDGSPWDLPRGVQGTTALVVHDRGATLTDLPEQPHGRATVRRTLEGRLDENGNLTEASLIESWTGSSAAAVRSHYSGSSLEDRRRRVTRDLQERFPGAVLEAYEIAGIDDVEAQVVERVRVGSARFGRRVGGDLLAVAPGGAANGILSAALPPPPRLLPVDLGFPREETVEIRLAPPDGWVPEELPAPVTIEATDAWAQAAHAFEDGRLVYRRTARLLHATAPVGRYEEIRAFARKLALADGAAVILAPRR